MLFARHHQGQNKRQFSTDIDFWHGYACLGDVIAHRYNLADVFDAPIRALGLFPRGRPFRTIDYIDLRNPFVVVARPRTRDRIKRNPYKSYGYLVQTRLGSWLADDLFDRLC